MVTNLPDIVIIKSVIITTFSLPMLHSNTFPTYFGFVTHMSAQHRRWYCTLSYHCYLHRTTIRSLSFERSILSSKTTMCMVHTRFRIKR